MAEWPQHTVEDLIARGVLAVGDGYRAKNVELALFGLPFARAGNIDDGFDFADADRFPENALSAVGDKVSRPGDVVFTSKGTVGRFAFVTKDVPRFVYSPQLCFWRSLDERVLDPRFLYCWLRSPDFRRQVDRVKAQTDMADYVSLGDQRLMAVPVPPLPEQRAIASVLGALDDKIELNRKMNRTLEELASALFKSWFVDFDPVVAKAEGRKPFGMSEEIAALFPDRFVDSAMGPIPEGWQVQPLDGIADFLNGLALQNFPAGKGPALPVVKIAQMRDDSTSGADQASASIPPEYRVTDGDLLFSWSGSLLVSIWCGGPGALNQHLFKVTSTAFPKWFVLEWLKIHLPEFQAIAADKATTMGHIRRHHLTEALVVVPPKPLLDVLDAVQGPLLERSIQNRLEARTLAALRDTLLPPLMSGELRIRDGDGVATGGAA